MFVICGAARKGGAGKTTTCINIIGAAVENKKTVGLIDLDPQGTITDWWNDRQQQQGIEDAPYLLNVSYARLREGVEEARRAGLDYLFIDTAPAAGKELESAIAVADLILIPCKASLADVNAIANTLDTVEAVGTPFAFVSTMGTKNTNLFTACVTHLSQRGPVAGVMTNSVKHAEMLEAGQHIFEYAPKSESAEQVREIYKFVRKFEAKK